MTKTTVASVGKTSNSVRTVIPMWIAELMDLDKGTKLSWKIILVGKNFLLKQFLSEKYFCWKKF